MNDFETRVLPVVTEWANRRFKDEGQVQDAIGVCWYRYQQTQTAKRLEVPAKSFAWVAIKETMAGRQLPGMKARGEDALDYAWRCSTMAEAADRRPGPDRIAQEREEFAILLTRLNAKQTAFLEIGTTGLKNQDIAHLLGVTPGRVSQMRREIERLRKE